MIEKQQARKGARPVSSPRRADLVAIIVIVVAAAAIGEAAIFVRPEFTRTSGFIFGDQSYSLFVASELLRGARLYRDISYPYGWLPVLLYLPFAVVFGNSPTVYLQFLLLASIGGVGLAYALLRRALAPAVACLVTLVGVIPVFVVPGSLLGGYLSSFYLPIERMMILLAALAWRHPERRSVRRSAALGAILAVMQNIKFGPGIAFAIVIAGFDATLLAMGRPAGGIARWLRLCTAMCGVLLAGEALRSLAAFMLLPAPIAADLMWPAYLIPAYPSPSLRWPAWGGARLLVAQYFNPLAGMILSCASAYWIIRERGKQQESAGGLLLLPLLFVFGAFTFFRTEHHFRQFAWMLAIGAAPAVARFRFCRALATAGWLPVLAIVIKSVTGSTAEGLVQMTCPNGWRLTTTRAMKARIDGMADAVHRLEAESAGPVMFYRNGSGFYVAYGVPHVSRETWFYANAVRPYELETLAEQYRALRAVVSCEGIPVFGEDFPLTLRDSLTQRLDSAVWRDEECAVFPLRKPAS